MQLGDFITVAGNVGIDVPFEVLITDDGSVKIDFHTMVAHVSYIVVEVGVTEAGCIGYRADQVTGVVVVVFNTTPQAIFEQAEINTGIELGALFPAELFVLTLSRRRQRH